MEINTRNVCILAHVDHGKTTLTDGLVAANGFISTQQTGTRFLDSRRDEQERGITIEASAISLSFSLNAQEYTINLVDSPGHVDFSAEVTSAARLCDGALVVVDAMEGVRTQTHTVLRQAWEEKIVPLLVLNKVDRLVAAMSPDEAYSHLEAILAQINSIMKSFRDHELMTKLNNNTMNHENVENLVCEYFAPHKGNVIFASAIDGWAFRISQFATIYAKKLNLNEALLNNSLWGPSYYNKKANEISNTPPSKSAKPMFVQFVLENIWAAYSCAFILPDIAKVSKIIIALGLAVRSPNHKDFLNKSKNVLRNIMAAWLPLPLAIFVAVVRKLPNPIQAQPNKVSILIPETCIQPSECDARKAICECDSESALVICYVSKMFGVEPKNMPAAKNILTQEEMKIIRERAIAKSIGLSTHTGDLSPLLGQIKIEEEHMVAFARIYSGTITVGQKVYVLNPKYDPLDEKTSKYSSEAIIIRLFAIMGCDLKDIPFAKAGMIFGILGLQSHVLKTATLSSSLECVSLECAKLQIAPIVRVAVEPKNPTQMNQLIRGLDLLSQADGCVQTYLQETGEYIVACAGELHLELCLKDLRDRFAKIEIDVSEPIVAFRETISLTSTIKPADMGVFIKCIPIPESVQLFLIESQAKIEHLQTIMDETSINQFIIELNQLLEDSDLKVDWKKMVQSIISFGPKLVGPNLLSYISESANVNTWGNLWSSLKSDSLESYIIHSFQTITQSGPLCGEPLCGVWFVIEKYPSIEDNSISQSKLKDLFTKCFQSSSPRIMTAMFNCEVQTPTDVLGNVYAVISRRRGKILKEDGKEGTPYFNITSSIPVIESFGFADEILKKTSGTATAQMVFSGFEVLDVDPFWMPSTDAELEEFGDLNSETRNTNISRKYIDSVRKRKGMIVDERLVQHGEKQKTLKSQ